jgi:cytoskeleton protein RodZ
MSMAHAGVDPGTPPAADPGGPGARLRSAREHAGLSLDQVAQALKLAPRQVKALEDEDFAQLPGRTFARGFVRNYARLLGLDSV